MYNFPELLKKIRDESGLTQEQLAKVLEVSTILISMIETGQKEVSRNFIVRLAEKMDVHPSSIAPFAFSEEKTKGAKVSVVEKTLVDLGEKLQVYLIKNKSKRLKEYV